ncbi:MAG: helix-turn-helix transcriptional regulator [Deltaproteobacteria bacterium]|jgi:DNA-binding CsgD family transcriptional regulator|nr:helix-turn-helix transcriptional regulator [Deltaproteobacteria bacterium]
MPLAVRQECRIFSILALVLFFISQSLGVYVAMSYRLQQSGIFLFAAVYYAGTFGFAAVLSFLSPTRTRAGRGLFAPLPLFLALCALLAFTGHLLGFRGYVFAFAFRAVAMGVFALAAIHAFFLFAPPQRKGLLLGLAVASGELIWIVVLPVMNAGFSYDPNPALLGRLHMLQMTLQCSIGILLATAFAIRRDRALADVPPDPVPDHAVKASALPLLFAAAALFYIAYGLASGLSFPKIGPGISENAHFPLLLTLPLAGALLDRGGRGCRMLLIVTAFLIVAAPLMVFIREAAMREALYAALCVGRQCVFIATLLLAVHLIRNRRRLPLPVALAFALPSASMMGSAVSRIGGETVLVGGIAIALALAFAFFAHRLRGALADLPAAGDEDALHPDRLAAFAAAYGLSEQETLVMKMLAQRRSSEEIATILNVKAVTVRTYISRLMHKTGAGSRAALMARYAVHSPAVDSGTTDF